MKPIGFECPVDIARNYEQDGRWILEGYAATSDLDSYEDVISDEALGAAAADLRENTTVLHSHDPDAPIGRVLEARAEPEGLFVKVLISKTVPEVWQQVTEGVLNKFSVGGEVIEAHREWMPELGQEVRVITRFRLHEVSLVALPANSRARALRWYVEKALHDFEKAGGRIARRRRTPAAPPVTVGTDDGREVKLDLEDLANPHFLCVGESGNGKTALVKCLAAQYAKNGKHVLVLDCQDDFVGEFAELTGACVIDLGREGLPFDPMEVPVDAHTGKPVKLALWIEEIASYFAAAYRQLGPVQLSLLKQAVANLYAAKRSFAELPSELRSMDEGSRSARPLQRLVHHISTPFVVGMFSRGTRGYAEIFAASPIVVVRVASGSAEVKTLLSMFLLKAFYDYVRAGTRAGELWSDGKSSPVDHIVIVDEMHLWNRPSQAVLQLLFRTGRKLGMSVWGVSQCLTDIDEAIIANSDTKVFFGTSSKGARGAVDQLPLTAKEKTGLRRELLKLGPGWAVLRNSAEQPYSKLKVLQFHTWAEKALAAPARQVTKSAPARTKAEESRPAEAEEHAARNEEAPVYVPEGPSEGTTDSPQVQFSRVVYASRNVGNEDAAAFLEERGIDSSLLKAAWLPLVFAETEHGLFRSKGIVYDPLRRQVVRKLRTLDVKNGPPPEVFGLSAAAQDLLRATLSAEGDEAEPPEAAAAELEAAGLVAMLPGRLKLLRPVSPPRVITIPKGKPTSQGDAQPLLPETEQRRAAAQLLRALALVFGIQAEECGLLMFPVCASGLDLLVTATSKPTLVAVSRQ